MIFFSNLTVLKILIENDLDQIYKDFDLKSVFREVDYWKLTEIISKSIDTFLYKMNVKMLSFSIFFCEILTKELKLWFGLKSSFSF